MTYPSFGAARTVRIWTLGLAVAVLTGCNSGDAGSGEFSQKFEPPPGGAAVTAPTQTAKPQSRREMIEEDRAEAKARSKSRAKSR